MSGFNHVFQGLQRKRLNGTVEEVFFVQASAAGGFFANLSEIKETDELRLIAMSNSNEKGNLILVFESVSGGSYLQMQIDCSQLEVVPSLREIWPMASWWEDELERLGAFRFFSQKKLEGIKWQH